MGEKCPIYSDLYVSVFATIWPLDGAQRLEV
jgi:hypothetical protein